MRNKIITLFIALIMTLPSLTVNAASSSASTEAEGEVNALYNTLADFLSDKSSEFVLSLDEQERIAFGEELKEVYIRGFEKDAYSRNLPFDSDYVRAVFDLCPIFFRDYYGAAVCQTSEEDNNETPFGTYIDMQLGIWLFDGDMASTFIRVTGVFLGLGDGLARLLENEYRGIAPDSRCDALGIWGHDQCFSELLMKRVGKTKFWEAAFTSQKAYEKLWNEHITTVPFQAFLEAMKLNQVAVAVYTHGDQDQRLTDILSGFGQHANFTRNLIDEFDYIHDALIQIEQGDNTQLSYVNAFFEKITSFEYSVWYETNVVFTLTINYLNANGANVKNLGSASSWAHDGITAAIAKGFVPADIRNNYTDVITRKEFCRIAVEWAEYVTGKSIDALLSEQGKSRDQDVFTDTSDPYVLAAFALDITNGVGNNLFNPSGHLTREQAAVMIMNTCRAIGVNVGADVRNFAMPGFSDMENAASWAVDGINFVRVYDIMQGTGGSNFSPTASYTREQGIITFNNINSQQIIEISTMQTH